MELPIGSQCSAVARSGSRNELIAVLLAVKAAMDWMSSAWIIATGFAGTNPSGFVELADGVEQRVKIKTREQRNSRRIIQK